MHASKDSMWRGIWKILQNFLGTKQGHKRIWEMGLQNLKINLIAQHIRCMEWHRDLITKSCLARTPPLLDPKAWFSSWNFFGFGYCSIFVYIWQLLSNYGLTMLKRFVSQITDTISFYFHLYLMLFACVQRFYICIYIPRKLNWLIIWKWMSNIVQTSKLLSCIHRAIWCT
jgi:hypothetical protein